MNTGKAAILAREGLDSLQRLSVMVGAALAKTETTSLASLRERLQETPPPRVIDLPSFEAGYRLALEDVLDHYVFHERQKSPPSSAKRLWYRFLLEILSVIE